MSYPSPEQEPRQETVDYIRTLEVLREVSSTAISAICAEQANQVVADAEQFTYEAAVLSPRRVVKEAETITLIAGVVDQIAVDKVIQEAEFVTAASSAGEYLDLEGEDIDPDLIVEAESITEISLREMQQSAFDSLKKNYEYKNSELLDFNHSPYNKENLKLFKPTINNSLPSTVSEKYLPNRSEHNLLDILPKDILPNWYSNKNPNQILPN